METAAILIGVAAIIWAISELLCAIPDQWLDKED